MPLEPLDKFRSICLAFPAIAIHRGRVTEADTRANLLDRVIHEVLGWPRRIEVVSREPFANPGFIDYQFSHGRPLLLMEAKAAGESFVFPYRKIRRRNVKIESSLLTDPVLAEAITQVQKYCSDTGCRFAVATNGYSYVVFRAILEGTAWKTGNAIVFHDFKDVEINFTEFWNLLSYEAVIDGKLDAAFRSSSYLSRGYYRPLDDRVDSDATYGRNPLNVFLRPYVERFFGDIAQQDTTEILTKCYVYSRPIQIIDNDLQLAIEDQIPNFAKTAKPTQHTPTDPGGNVGRAITSAVVSRPMHGSVILVMGGIGSGKSTFCRRFFRLVAPGLVATNGYAALLYLNFLGAPDEPAQLDDFLWECVANELKITEPSLVTRQKLEEIFKSEIDITNEIYGAVDPSTAGRISELLVGLFRTSKRFAESALKYCASRLRMPIIVFDNVDQLTMTAQVQLFTAAQRFANMLGCVSLLVLREESYSIALLKKHLTATTIKPYHLSSPSFRELMATRIAVAITDAQTQSKQGTATEDQREYGNIVTLFQLLEHSVLGRNQNIIRLVESIAYGNMRLALTLFNNFITSGATDILKIIRSYKSRGGYTVPFHEFAKSIILGDFQYFRETRSLITNLFEVTRKPNASHFTALRILNYLASAPSSQNGGCEFVVLQDLLTEINEAFANEDDAKETVLRLVALDRQLVELDTRRTDTISGASLIRGTSAGIYYLRFLSNAFAYCDLVWHDTPFHDRAISDALGKLIRETAMAIRFERVDIFLSYLRSEEEREFAERGIDYGGQSYWGPFMPRIKRHIENEKNVIRRILGLSF